MSTLKVLTVGPTYGSLVDLFAKIKNIDAKHGKFAFCLCTGDFFGPLEQANQPDSDVNQLLDGKLDVPIECYIMQGENPLPDAVIQKFAKTSGELCKNVFLMTKSGLITTADGLRMACLGGIYDGQVFDSCESPPGFASPFFSSQSIDRLLSNTTSSSTKDYKSLAAISTQATSQLVDILLTNTWPASIPHFSNVPIPPSSPHTAPPLDALIRQLKPRYHFAAAGNIFWEREPFVWEPENSEGTERITRFVSLGPFGNPASSEEKEKDKGGKKQRWFYAFSIAVQSGATTRPSNATKNPFVETLGQQRHLKRAFEDSTSGENFIWGNVPQAGNVKRTRMDNNGKPPPGYKCHRCESSDHFISECPERTKPPEGYVCRVCNTPGHLVRDCPTRHAVGDTGGKKPKEGYVCRGCGSENHYLDDCPVIKSGSGSGSGSGGRGKRDRGPPKDIAPDECWFCLSNPNLAKHLVVAIGSECYVTLPKGQIVPTRTNEGRGGGIPGGGHVLIVPITHYPTYSTIPGDLVDGIVDETEKYKSALRSLYAKYNCNAIFFEVGRLSGRGKGGHAHVQAVPIPKRLASRAEEEFIKQGKEVGITFEVGEEADKALEACKEGRGGYFRVDLDEAHGNGGGGRTRRTIVHLIRDGVPFGVQFGRQVIVNLLGMPERLDWKACALDEEEDRADAQAFKEAFRAFDPSG